ncbi:protein MON2 homolog [Glossina fuscipes fuscipes]
MRDITFAESSRCFHNGHLCASFPPHYAISFFANNPYLDVDLRCRTRSSSQDLNNQFMSTCTDAGDFRQQIVPVGTPLSSVSVMLTTKNLQSSCLDIGLKAIYWRESAGFS